MKESRLADEAFQLGHETEVTEPSVIVQTISHVDENYTWKVDRAREAQEKTLASLLKTYKFSGFSSVLLEIIHPRSSQFKPSQAWLPSAL